MRVSTIPTVWLFAFITALSASTVWAERPATVLLITSKDLAPAWQDFSDWKTSLGKATKIVTVQEIDAKHKGKDIQDKIRACVLDHIDKHGTHWVVLGGDSKPGGKGHVPDRDTLHPMMRYRDIPTDVYFLSKKSWDTNGDGVYGDWANDRKDISYTNGKVSIGRIPVGSVEDVKAYTAKSKAYESHYPKTQFAQRMIYNCPIPMAFPKLNTSRKVVKDVWKIGEVDQAFTNAGQKQKSLVGDGKLTSKFISNMINQKQAGKMHMHGHGLLKLWALEGHTQFDKSTVDKLTNYQAYPIITTVSCFTGQFDSAKGPSITESMLRKDKGGAIAIIAPAREGVPIFANRADFQKMITEGKMDGTTRILTNFWQAGLESNTSIGEAWVAARAQMAKEAAAHPGYHWVQSEINLLGDPTLAMRNADPIEPKLQTPKSIKTGKQTIKVTTGVADAQVCAWMGDQVYQTVQTDVKGNASITITTAKPGTLLITVSGSKINAKQNKVQVK
jgi:hypothetical protein